VVTGASRGIGFEVCRQLSALGYVVVLGSRDLRRAELAAKELDPDQQRVIGVHIEVDNSVNIDQLAEWISAAYGRVDVIVNNAATEPDLWGIAGTTDLSPVAEALDVNLFGTWRVVQALLPLLRSSPRPRIVNVSSESGAIALMSAAVADINTKIANDQNEVVKRLTVIASILLVPTFIVGLYGQNFRHIPELAWGFGYWWSWGWIILTTILQLAFFRWLGWIGGGQVRELKAPPLQTLDPRTLRGRRRRATST